MLAIFTALMLGAAAGLIDIAPMLRTQAPRSSILSIFFQWVLLGLIIPFVEWDLPPWLKGMLIGLAGMVPIAVIAFHRNRPAVPGILLYGLFLGAGIGVAGSQLIR